MGGRLVSVQRSRRAFGRPWVGGWSGNSTLRLFRNRRYVLYVHILQIPTVRSVLPVAQRPDLATNDGRDRLGSAGTDAARLLDASGATLRVKANAWVDVSYQSSGVLEPLESLGSAAGAGRARGLFRNRRYVLMVHILQTTVRSVLLVVQRTRTSAN